MFRENTSRWISESSSLIDGVSFTSTKRLQVALALLNLSIEHQMAIHSLVGPGFLGSAFALLRPQVETYVRGVWFLHCATEIEIDKFLNGSEPPSFGALINAIQNIQGYKDGSLGRAKTAIWSELNDFTHGGCTQVKSRNSKTEIVCTYTDEEIENLLRSSTNWGLLAGIAVLGAADKVHLAEHLFAIHQNIFGASA